MSTIVDGKIPALRGSDLVERLVARLESLGALEPGCRLHLRLMKYKPGKQAVAWLYASPEATRDQFVFKMYRKGRAISVFKRMETLWLIRDQGTVPFKGFMPRPLSLLGELDGVLLEKIEGTPYDDTAPLAMQKKWVAWAGEALAWLHGLPFHRAKGIPRRELSYWVEKFVLRNLPTDASPAVSQTRTILLDLANQLQQGDGKDDTDPVICHGDFSPSQIFIQPYHATILDFDSLAISHGGLDIANFLLSLRAHTTGPNHFSELAHRFLRAYSPAEIFPEKTWNPYFALILMRRFCMAWKKADHFDPTVAIGDLYLAQDLLGGATSWRQIITGDR